MSDNPRKQRKFSNIKLTQKHHYHHMGLWVIITVSLIILINYLLYALILQQWEFSTGMGGFSRSVAMQVAGVLLIEAVLLSAAIILMAKTTSHRIAGVFIAIKNTCDRVAAGDHEARQHFRKYDQLDDLETLINGMLDQLCGKQS